jgi:hypothetical protein
MLFSDANPMMASVAMSAQLVRSDRRPVGSDNPLLAIQERISNQIVAGLDAWRKVNEAFAERAFLWIYGSERLQAAVGIDPCVNRPSRKAAKSLLHTELLRSKVAELRSRIAAGGLREAVVRALIYAGMTRAAVDERGFELTRRIRKVYGEMPLSDFKALVREQFNILLIDQERALRAIPSMLPPDAETRHEALDLIGRVLAGRGEKSAEDEKRLRELTRLFAMGKERGSDVTPAFGDRDRATKSDPSAHAH